MRRGGNWACALALSLGLALAALAQVAQADDDAKNNDARNGDAKPAKSGNWLTRMFTGNDSAKKKDSAKKDEPALSPAQVRQQAYWEWQRRLEVCDKLKQIAFETGDRELDRKADDLDQRAWDIYVQRTGGKDAHNHDDRPAGAQRSGAASNSTSSDSRQAARRD